MKYQEQVVWLNGAFCEGSSHLSIRDRGFLLGDGAFETILLRSGIPAFLDEHIGRLHEALKVLRIKSITFTAWRTILKKLWALNKYSNEWGIARITITRGVGGRGLMPESAEPTILISVEKLGYKAEKFIRLMSSGMRKYSGAFYNSFKSISGYQENTLARFDAIDAGFDDALLLNEFGRVSSATSANVFLINTSGDIITPALCEGALPGVVRSIVIDSALQIGLAVAEKPVATDELAAGNIFLTNSLIGLCPAQLDSKSVMKSHDTFMQLKAAYTDRLEKDLLLGRGV